MNNFQHFWYSVFRLKWYLLWKKGRTKVSALSQSSKELFPSAKQYKNCILKRYSHEELLCLQYFANTQHLDPYKLSWRFITLSWNVPVRNCSCMSCLVWDTATNKSDKQTATVKWIASDGVSACSVICGLLWLKRTIFAKE